MPVVFIYSVLVILWCKFKFVETVVADGSQCVNLAVVPTVCQSLDHCWCCHAVQDGWRFLPCSGLSPARSCLNKTQKTLALSLRRLSTSLRQRRSPWTLPLPFMIQLQLTPLLWTPKIPVSRSNCQRTRSNGWIRASECLRFWETLIPIAVPY